MRYLLIFVILFGVSLRLVAAPPDEISRLRSQATTLSGTRLVQTYENLTIAYINRFDSYKAKDGRLDSARYFNALHLSTAEDSRDQLAQADAMTLKGKIAHLDISFRESYIANYEAYRLYQGFRPEQCKYLFECLKRMGRIHYATLGDNKTAFTYFESGLGVAKSPSERSLMLRQMALCLQNEKQFARSQAFLEKAYLEAQQAGNTYDMGMTLNFQAENLAALGDTAAAIAKIETVFQTDSSTITQATGRLILTKILLKQGAFEEAFTQASAAYALACMEKNDVQARSEALAYLAEASKKLRKFEQSIAFQERFKLTNDSLSKSAGLQDFYKLMVENERIKLTEKEAEATRERNQKFFFFGIALLFLAAGGILYSLYRALARKSQEINLKNEQIADLNKNLELRVEERTQELRTANEELLQKNREIEEALFRGQVMERKRVAEELHDNLGALLSAAKMSVSALKSSPLSVSARKIYENVVELVGEASKEVRQISHNLHTQDIENSGLAVALEKLTERLNYNAKTNFSLDTTKWQGESKSIELELYGLVSELCNNVLKHAAATQANVLLVHQEDGFLLEVSDDGRGLPEQTFSGLGMKTISNRSTNLGGNSAFVSRPEGGTIFRLFVKKE